VIVAIARRAESPPPNPRRWLRTTTRRRVTDAQ